MANRWLIVAVKIVGELLNAVKQDRALRDNLLLRARAASEGLSYSELNSLNPIRNLAIDNF